jgi:hypothetical protein
MDLNPYKAPRFDEILEVKSCSPPSRWIAFFVSIVCAYVPVAWISFSSRASLWWSQSERAIFLITSPGEWLAQRCGARAYDYYFFAGLSTLLLLAAGYVVGRQGWLWLAIGNTALLGFSIFTAQWLWTRLAS